jgi:energy-converting hydrogenase A subunit M
MNTRITGDTAGRRNEEKCRNFEKYLRTNVAFNGDQPKSMSSKLEIHKLQLQNITTRKTNFLSVSFNHSLRIHPKYIMAKGIRSKPCRKHRQEFRNTIGAVRFT